MDPVYEFLVMDYFFFLEFNDLIISEVALFEFFAIIFYLLLDGVKDILPSVKFEDIAALFNDCVVFYI